MVHPAAEGIHLQALAQGGPRSTEPLDRTRPHTPAPSEQLPLFGQSPPVVDELLKLDVSSMTPLEAITKLYELQQKARE